MAELINAKCPNCGANLQLPEHLDRAYCTQCGGGSEGPQVGLGAISGGGDGVISLGWAPG